MTVSSLDDIQSAFHVPAMLRLPLNALQDEMLRNWKPTIYERWLNGLREKLQKLELREIRLVGPQEYLPIKPLAPDAGGEFAEKAAEHVRALDDLGLVVRLGR
jgi:hypothetical protein